MSERMESIRRMAKAADDAGLYDEVILPDDYEPTPPPTTAPSEGGLAAPMPYCGNENGGFVCNRPRGHKGDHWEANAIGRGKVGWLNRKAENAAVPATPPKFIDEILAEKDERIAQLEADAQRLPADWFKDSSLETWFPFTAEELIRLRAEVERLKGLLRERANIACIYACDDESPKHTTECIAAGRALLCS